MGESNLPMRPMVGDVPPMAIQNPPVQEVDFLGAGDQRAKQLRDAVRSLTQIFPDICPEAASAHLELLSELQPLEQALQSTVNMYIDKRFLRSITVPGNVASTSNSAPNPDGRPFRTLRRLLTKGYRSRSRPRPEIKCPHFEKELKAPLSEEQLVVEFDKVSVNNVEAVHPQEEALIECGCCCSETPFEEVVQCADGHLFCKSCLRRHLEGYIFGVSQTCELPLCMDTNGCDKTFPWSEVKRSLPLDVLSKYQQCHAEDSVARARLEGLVYCPFCNYPWEVDREISVLNCGNEMCKKSSCIKCKEPSHIPLRCEEVEKKSETAARRIVEERMARALIRECISCRAELVKIDGCNKITCRCGQIMCHVCRQPITDYKHFCQHPLQPGNPCTQCSACFLWEKENAAEVVEAAKMAAIKEAVTHDPGLLKLQIGPSDAAGTPQTQKL